MDPKISKAQHDVWEWKEKAYESLSHLPTMKEKLAEINRRTKKVAEAMNSQIKTTRSTKPVSESR